MRRALSIIAATAALVASPLAGQARAAEQPAAGPALWVVPAMRSWQPRPGDWTLGRRTRIVIASNQADLRPIAETLADDVATIAGVRPGIVIGTAANGDIALTIGRTHAQSKSPEAYDLDIAATVVIRGASPDGVFAGAQSLLQLLEHDPRARSIPRGAASDWPAYGRRMMMIDAGRKYYAPASIEAEMRKMAWLKMNTLHLHFTDWPAFRLDSPRFPGLAPKGESYDRDAIAQLEATARRYHITIIPEIDLPAHASALIRYRPSLAFACPALRQSPWLTGAAGDTAKDLAWVVDITRQENRDFIKTLLDEFIPWFDGPYFHLGGDEYNYDADKTRCPELMAFSKTKGFAYPGDVFVDWVNQADRIVRSHGKTSVIWSWWRFRDDKTSIEPNTDIVIDTWNTPRLKAILADGYTVFVSPEDELYVSPGLAKGPGSYGTVDTRREYESLDLVQGPQVLGYGVSLWADGAERRSDAAMLGKVYEPMAVLAERLWSGRRSPSIDSFRKRLSNVGAAPNSAAAD